jgi:MSHA pilin protein MshD
MDEILTKKYDHGTPQGGVDADGNPYSGPCNIDDNGQVRAVFDDVDDYNDLTESPASAVASISGYNDFDVAISVTCAGADVGLANANAKRIDITITDPGDQSFGFSAYRVNF